jgi:outer membrane protein
MRHAVVLAVAFLLPAAAVRADIKIGYVDVQRALNEVEDGRDAKAKLKKEFDDKQRMLDEKQEELRVIKEDIDKQSGLLTPEAKQEKLNDLQKKMLELQQMYMNMQKDLQEREGQVTKGIFERMNRVLNQIAEEENYGLILERNESSILYARGHMDLTNEVIRKYNDLLGKERASGKSGGGAATPKKDKEPKKKKDPPAEGAPR